MGETRINPLKPNQKKNVSKRFAFQLDVREEKETEAVSIIQGRNIPIT